MDEDDEKQSVDLSILNPDPKLLLDYRKAIEETQKFGFKDPDFLEQSFARADELYLKIKGPTEALYDAKLVNIHSLLVKQKTDALHTTSFDAEEFGNSMVGHFNKGKTLGADMWRELGRKSKLAIVSSPAIHFMNGTFEPGAVELKRKARKERTKDEQGKLLKPNLVSPNTSKDENTTSEVERVFSILTSLCNKQGSSLSYFEFVVNPFSFSETIENMFHLAVLVKECAVRIYPDDDGHPFIDPIPGFQQQSARAHRPAAQAIYSLSPDTWKKIIKKYNITKPRIPSRNRTT